jgi:AcrR family transcriptional regulator
MANARSEAADLESETKGERTRRRLLEIARERFGVRGFRATSVTEIAREAQLTQAAAYAYFQNKEDLFRSAVDADAAALIAETLDQLGGVPIRQLGPAFLVYAVAGLDRHPLAQRVLAGLEPEANERLRDLPALAEVTRLFAERIATAQAAGEVRADVDPEVMADGMEVLIVGLLTSSVLSGGRPALVRHQVAVVEVFDALLRPPA